MSLTLSHFNPLLIPILNQFRGTGRSFFASYFTILVIYSKITAFLFFGWCKTKQKKRLDVIGTLLGNSILSVKDSISSVRMLYESLNGEPTCRLPVEISLLCRLLVKMFDLCRLSVNPSYFFAASW